MSDSNYTYLEAAARRKKKNQVISILIIIAVVLVGVAIWGVREHQKNEAAERIKNALNSQAEAPSFAEETVSAEEQAVVASPTPEPENEAEPLVEVKPPEERVAPPKPVKPKPVAPPVDVEANAAAEAEKKAQAEAKRLARLEEARTREEAAAKASETAEADKKTQAEARRLAREEAAAKAKAEAEEKAQAKAQAKATAEADKKAQAEAKRLAREEAAAKAKAEAEAKALAKTQAAKPSPTPAKTFAPEDLPLPSKPEASEETRVAVNTMAKVAEVSSAAPAVAPAASDAFKQGMAAFKQNDFANATRLFSQLSKPATKKRGDPVRDEYVQGNFMRGVALLRTNHTSEAVTAFLSVLEFEKYYPLANLNLGICYVDLKQYAKAHKAFESVVRDQNYIEPAMFDDVMQRTKYFWALAWTRMFKNSKDPDKQAYYRQQSILRWKDYEIWFGKNTRYRAENQKADDYLKSLSSL